MSRVYTDTVLPEDSGVGQDQILGAVGDTVTIPAGATLKTNKIFDAGGNNIITSDGAGTLTVNSAFEGDEVLISTQTLSSAVSYLEFTTGFTDTYFLFRLVFMGVKPATDNTHLQWTPSTDNINWNADTRGFAYWLQYQGEASSGGLDYRQADDGPSGTADITIGNKLGNDSDQSCSGTLYCFNFSKSGYGAGAYSGNATKGTKNFYSEASYSQHDNFAQSSYTCGRIQATSPITGVRFKFSSGNIAAGTFKLYGLI